MSKKGLQQMKDAGEQQNWDAFRKALKSIICDVKHEALLKVLLPYVQIFMNDFLSTNPQYESKYTELSTSKNDQNSVKYLAGIIEILEEHWGEPGVNNFRKAILKFQSLFALNHCDEIYVEAFLSSTTNLLIAIPSQTWGKKHLQLHNQWQYGTVNEALSISVMDYATNPDTIQQEKLLFQQFTSDISLLIEAGE